MSYSIRCFAIVAALLVSQSVSAQVTLRKGQYVVDDRTLAAYTMENERLRLSLLPEKGGMAWELIDKHGDNANLIHIPPGFTGYGGLFDDHGQRTVAPYALQVLADTPERCSLQLTSIVNDTTYAKTITLRAGQPMIEVAYRIVNAGQSPLGFVLFRNCIRPGGGEFTDAELYLMPLTTGVQRTREGFGRTENIGAPWSGLVHTGQQRGVSIVYAGDKLKRFYSWNGSKVAPTYEWMLTPLQPGTQYTTTYYVKVTHGFSGYSDSTRLYTADSRVVPQQGREMKVVTRLSASWEPLKRVAAACRFHPVGGTRPEAATEVDFGDVAVDVPVEKTISWQAPADGAYVLDVTVLAEGKAIGRYEEVFTVGAAGKAATAAYNRKVAWAAADTVEALPGWKKIDRYVIQPTPEEKERGYLVFEEYGPEAGKDVQRFAVDVGMGERESICFGLMPFKDVGAVRLQVKSGTLPADKLRVTAAELVPQENWGRVHLGHKLLDSDQLPTKANEASWFWALLEPADMRPGEYTARLVLTPEKAPAKEIALIVRVAAVLFPQDLFLFFNPNTLFNYLTSSGKDRRWDERKGRLYAADMQRHGVRVMNTASTGGPGMDPARIRLRETGEPLLDAIRKDPARFREGPLPALDLSDWDRLINLALEYDQYIWHSPLGSEGTYDHNFIAVTQAIYGKDAVPASPEHARIRQWMLAAIPQYLREKGYRRLNISIGDEIPFDRFAKWAEKAGEARKLGFAPGVTTSAKTLANREYLKLLAGPSDYWIIGTLNDETLAAARRDGFIEKTDWVETYCSSANFWQSYETMRRWAGWWPAYFELDAVWIQEYWRWNKAAAVIFPDDENGPKTSGAWEGCRDGLEDANYYYMALDLVRAMAGDPASADLARRARLELESISGKAENSLIRFQYGDSDVGRTLNCVTTDTWKFREAKRRLLEFIVRYGAQAPKRSLVKWGDTVIARDGVSHFRVRTGRGLGEAGQMIDGHIQSQGAKPSSGSGASLILVITREDKDQLDEIARRGMQLAMTPAYPRPGSYLIAQDPLGPIVILGGDTAGALLGARNACKFIRSVRPEF